jgi:hypothetical protein
MAESESIAALIITVRGQKVLLDSDLAALYGVTTKRFNEQLSATEIASLRILCFSGHKKSSMH